MAVSWNTFPLTGYPLPFIVSQDKVEWTHSETHCGAVSCWSVCRFIGNEWLTTVFCGFVHIISV